MLRLVLVLLLVVSTAGSMVRVGLAAPSVLRSAATTDVADVAADGLGGEIDALLADATGVYGVVVMTADGQTLYSRNSEVPFVAASLYKLLVMATVYELEAAGELTLDEQLSLGGTVTDGLFAMIVHSDNNASHALLDLVGGPDAVNKTAQRLGLEYTRVFIDPATLPDWPPAPARDSTERATELGSAFVLDAASDGGADVTTPRDVARFFHLLLDGRVVSPEASEAMLALLEQQQINDRLPVLLPPETAVAHKTGNLPGVIHDAGVITTPAGPVIVAALSEAMPDEDQAIKTIQELALSVYETATPLPQWAPRPNR